MDFVASGLACGITRGYKPGGTQCSGWSATLVLRPAVLSGRTGSVLKIVVWGVVGVFFVLSLFAAEYVQRAADGFGQIFLR
jgi:hypothetical protein